MSNQPELNHIEKPLTACTSTVCPNTCWRHNLTENQLSNKQDFYVDLKCRNQKFAEEKVYV